MPQETVSPTSVPSDDDTASLKCNTMSTRAAGRAGRQGRPERGGAGRGDHAEEEEASAQGPDAGRSPGASGWARPTPESPGPRAFRPRRKRREWRSILGTRSPFPAGDVDPAESLHDGESLPRFLVDREDAGRALCRGGAADRRGGHPGHARRAGSPGSRTPRASSAQSTTVSPTRCRSELRRPCSPTAGPCRWCRGPAGRRPSCSSPAAY